MQVVWLFTLYMMIMFFFLSKLGKRSKGLAYGAADKPSTLKHGITSGRVCQRFHVLLQRPTPSSEKNVISSPTQPFMVPQKDAVTEAMRMVLPCNKNSWCAGKPKTAIARKNPPPTNQVPLY